MEFRENNETPYAKADTPFIPPVIEYAERVNNTIEEDKKMNFPSKQSENLRNFYLKSGDTFITDFDSCLCADETLDKIIELAIADRTDFEELKQEINDIMSAGMRGKISLRESIQLRLNIAALGGGITPKLLKEYLKIAPAPSKEFIKVLKRNKEKGIQNLIFSGGFTQFIEDWCEKHEISEYIDGIYANDLILQKDGTYTFDKENLMAEREGKTLTAEKLKKEKIITGKVLSIGDSERDVSIGDEGILFTEHRAPTKELYKSSQNSLDNDSNLEEFVKAA